MSHRLLGTLLVLAIPLLLAPAPAAAQQETAAGSWTRPLTPWGDPDPAGHLDEYDHHAAGATRGAGRQGGAHR